MDLGLKGRVAMVSGASKGLGFAVAQVLAQEGALVSMSSSNPEAITQAGETIQKATGSGVLAMAADVRSLPALTEWKDATVKEFGAVDMLFANTGGPPAGEFMSFSDEAWNDAFDLLALSVIRMIRLVVPEMTKQQGGSIVMSTSSAVKEPILNLTLSNVVRATVPALAKTLAVELSQYKIRVNTVLPGRIDTDRVRNLEQVNASRLNISVPEYRKGMFATIPLRRYGTPEEYARAVVFLLSDASSFSTGTSVQVDGGMIRSVY